jgi:hypothetical protein
MSVRITYLERTNAMRNKERQKGQSTRYQVLIALKISLVFMVVTLCGLVGRYQHFRGTHYLHLQTWLKSTMSQLKVRPRRYFGRRNNRISDKFRKTKIATHGRRFSVRRGTDMNTIPSDWCWRKTGSWKSPRKRYQQARAASKIEVNKNELRLPGNAVGKPGLILLRVTTIPESYSQEA